jgi:hypothetical protein
MSKIIHKILLYFFSIMGMVVPGSTYWPITYGLKQGEVLQDAEGLRPSKTWQKISPGLRKNYTPKELWSCL